MGGLSFLNSGLLIFAAATVLPLLIWLLAKKKPKRIVFPTLRFIKASQEQEKKRTRLKNIILLIIRMLIILLVTLAATRPLLQTKHLKPAKKHPPTAIAVMLDTSFSLDYTDESKSDLDRAKDALRKINSLFTPQDRVIPITSDADWNRLHAQIYAGQVPDDLIKQIGVTYSPLRLQEMLNLAQDKLRETQLANRELYLLTDGQKQAYPAAPGQTLYVINVANRHEQTNLSCAGARVLPQLVEKSRRQSIEFQLTNHGSTDRQDVLVKVVLGQAKVAEKFVDLPARQTVNQSITVDLQQDGWQSGYVEVLDDRLVHDNRSYFAFPFQLAPRIAVVSDTQNLPPSLHSLLKVFTGAGGRIDILDPQQISLATLDQYQSFVFNSSAYLSPRLREIIAALKTARRGALFCAGPNLSAEYKSFLGSLFGVGFGSFQSQAQTVSYINPHHFATQLMQGTNLRFNQIADFWKITGQGATTLLSGAAGPFALARDNFVLWNLDLASQRSTFLLDAAFAVFAYRSLEFTSSVIAAGTRYNLGDAVTASKITLPDGNSLDLANQPYKLTQPGIYALQKADGTSTLAAVDTPRQESEFSLMDFKGLKNTKLLGKNWQSALFHTRLGHDLWKILLAAALALFLLEIILVKAEELRSPPTAKNP